ncbi:glycoside hydrolase family 3 N-terminal domain-containing protein [Microbacterium sp. SLBN-146]|uniref:glycoside hydrolase family 3 N-terminal domain-containing protein n=1 Tax=Microbacterium sp. SLBN-146 TaxID=2768457 RepID=UPI00116D530C|nr:glycoside hydrolase family 3 N-terminal domain-containing protein [Microbacterium sp. SLBN-146]TQJ32055.1 beta-N-acetylhexosaminidase [Microbacterium sp. SLBN-146]
MKHVRVAVGVVVGALLLAGAAPVSAVVTMDVPDSTGTVTVRAATDAERSARTEQRLATLSTREKAASIVMGHIPTTDAAALRAYVESTDVGGFILMGANIPGDESQLRALTAALTVDPALPPVIAVDQEGDDVSRLPWDDFPAATTLKYEAPEATASAFAGRGALLQRAGIGVNFGVVADVTNDRSMFIYRRALGTTPESGAAHVAAAVQGENSTVFSTLKHFPGHGAAPGDSHAGIPSTPMSREEWRATDAAPFAAGIDAGAPLLMFGHLAYTAVDTTPASLSAEWHRIARDDLGFDGVMITDDLGMLEASGIPAYSDPVANAVSAVAAGNDMVLAVVYTSPGSAGAIIDGLVAAVESGALPAERLDDAARRVLQLRLDTAAAGRGMLPCSECVAVR